MCLKAERLAVIEWSLHSLASTELGFKAIGGKYAYPTPVLFSVLCNFSTLQPVFEVIIFSPRGKWSDSIDLIMNYINL